MMPLVGAEEIILFAVGQKDSGDHTGYGQFVQDSIDRGRPILPSLA